METTLRFRTMTGKLRKDLLALRTNPRFKYIRLVEYYVSPTTYGFGVEEYGPETFDAFETHVNELQAPTVQTDKTTAYSCPVSFSIDFHERLNGKSVSDETFVSDITNRFRKYV